MFSSKERKNKITVEVEITRSLDGWLYMSINDLGLVFNFSVRTHNILKSYGIRKLRELLYFSKKGLTEGTGITTEQFNALSFDDRKWLNYIEDEYKTKLVNLEEPRKYKIGPSSMKEINTMLEKLGLKLNGE